MSSSQSDSGGRRRDPLIDLWRGLALVDMAWVHLAAYPIGLHVDLASWISDHTRFAAGCFVLLSGMTVARVFGPGLAGGPGPARVAGHRLARRALLLLLVDRLAAVTFAAIEFARLVPPGVHPPFPDFFALATFRAGGVTGGLLLLYAFLLAATPALEILRTRGGAAATLAVSFTAYAFAHAAGPSAHGPPWAFPIAHWQPLFVIGYLVSPEIDRLRTRSGTIAWWWLAAVSIACASLAVVRSGAAFGLDAASLPGWSFTKVPLQPAEFAWYLASSAFVLSWSAWLYESGPRARAALAWACALGRRSLLVYVAHLFLEVPIVEIVTLIEPSAPACALLLPVMAVAMRAVAAAGERVERWKPLAPQRHPLAVLRRLVPAAGTTGVGVAMATLASVLVLQAVVEPPQSWETMRHATRGTHADRVEDVRRFETAAGPPATVPEMMIDDPVELRGVGRASPISARLATPW